MTALLSKNAKKAIGVEIVPEAVECANELAQMNSLQDKITNYLGKCEDIVPDIIAKERAEGNKVCLVLDPPRKGCDKKVLDAILSVKPQKIVYVSCSPQTLARDLGMLCGTLYYDGNELKKSLEINGVYKITKVQPYDMFPQTKHVETLVCLERV